MAVGSREIGSFAATASLGLGGKEVRSPAVTSVSGKLPVKPKRFLTLQDKADEFLKVKKGGGSRAARPKKSAATKGPGFSDISVQTYFNQLMLCQHLRDLDRYRLKLSFENVHNNPHFKSEERGILKLAIVFIASLCVRKLKVEKSMELLGAADPSDPQDVRGILGQIAYEFPSLAAESLERIHQTDPEKPSLAQIAKHLVVAMNAWK
jgi:hypothetical protein